jgi:hypothetical protein
LQHDAVEAPLGRLEASLQDVVSELEPRVGETVALAPLADDPQMGASRGLALGDPLAVDLAAVDEEQLRLHVTLLFVALVKTTNGASRNRQRSWRALSNA